MSRGYNEPYAYNAALLRPRFPPEYPLTFYPPRCPHCRALLERERKAAAFVTLTCAACGFHTLEVDTRFFPE